MAFRDLIDVGQQCKRLLDAGRVQTLERMGFDVELLVSWAAPASALLIVFLAQHFTPVPRSPSPDPAAVHGSRDHARERAARGRTPKGCLKRAVSFT
jgi:hypothetical protein